MKLHELQEQYFDKFVKDNDLKTGGIPISSNDFYKKLIDIHGGDVYWTIGTVRQLMTKTFMKRQNTTTGKTEYYINKEL